MLYAIAMGQITIIIIIITSATQKKAFMFSCYWHIFY